MSKFKVGPAKTKGGYEAVIFEITDSRIFGKAYISGWVAMSWLPNGNARQGREDDYDLFPNNEQLRAEFEEVVKDAILFEKDKKYLRYVVVVPDEFEGKRVKVTLESLE